LESDLDVPGARARGRARAALRRAQRGDTARQHARRALARRPRRVRSAHRLVAVDARDSARALPGHEVLGVRGARMSGRGRLIVNADDFGIAAAVNRGIAEAFDRGIVTSASLMAT